MLFDMLHYLKFYLEYVLTWLKVNSLKPNPGKFQFMRLETNPYIKVNFFLERNKTEKNQKVALLGITIGDKLNFKTHNEDICRLANYKLHVLQCIRKHLSTDKTNTLCNASLSSQFY